MFAPPHTRRNKTSRKTVENEVRLHSPVPVPLHLPALAPVPVPLPAWLSIQNVAPRRLPLATHTPSFATALAKLW